MRVLFESIKTFGALVAFVLCWIGLFALLGDTNFFSKESKPTVTQEVYLQRILDEERKQTNILLKELKQLREAQKT